MSDLVERLIGWCTDWNGEPMVRGEPPRDGLHCDILLDAVARIRELEAERDELQAALDSDWPQMAVALKLAKKVEAERDALLKRVADFKADIALLRANWMKGEWIKAECDAIRAQTIEECAQVVDQCNHEGPYNAIGAASRIRALAK